MRSTEDTDHYFGHGYGDALHDREKQTVRERQAQLERERRIRAGTCCAQGGPPAVEDGTAHWEDTLTEHDLDEMMAAGEPVELVDEPAEDVIAAFAAGEKGVTAMPDEKRQIVTWLAESGFHAAAEAFTEWLGPAPKPLARRLREAHELVDWLRHYQVRPILVVNGSAITGIRCTRHADGDVKQHIVPGFRDDGVIDQDGLTLDVLFDHAAAHEIAEHGDR